MSDLLQPEHYSGLQPYTRVQRDAPSDYEVVDGVLLSPADEIHHQSREYVEAGWPDDFRGGGPDPSIGTASPVVTRRKEV